MKVLASTALGTEFGLLDVRLLQSSGGKTALVLSRPWEDVPYVRIHSACLFGEAFHSHECDCQWQLDATLQRIGTSGGILVYLFQEGRDVGLEAKIKAMELQRSHGLSTVEAFRRLGLPIDPRDYGVAVEALRALNCPRRIICATANPNKVAAILKGGFEIARRVSIDASLPPAVLRVVQHTRIALGHLNGGSIDNE